LKVLQENRKWFLLYAHKDNTEEQPQEKAQDRAKWWAREINVPADEWKGPPGPRNLPQEALTIESAFKLLFDEEIWQHLETETDAYAKKEGLDKGMTRKEISTYLAVLLAMGLSPEMSLHEYWNETDPWVRNEGIANVCSREQFKLWNSIFHFNIDWMIERCVVNSKAHWSPHKRMAIDEWLQAWKGTWRNRQYIKGKPHQNGLKWYLFADITTYVWDFWLYKGKQIN